MSRCNPADVAGGLFVAAIGAAFAAVAAGYPLGQLANPGPGVFPLATGIITAVVGLGIAVKGFLRSGEVRITISHRSVIAVVASVAAFALMIRPLGLVPTLFVVVLVAALGSSKSRPLHALAVAVATAAGGWLVFIVGLGLPIPAIRMPF
ncbi:tripartite tricarboxylate transporter TctB family protein [Chelativorans salis]|uniref:Tripartite tricarboxylate transporter TctB family protein n=1 Tax=Chelativorans salis TaxID=2978478 RepID=A0ABT2LUC1_9HYPH|nr:tripartite tricarboxylate transporter TctB family protein [Chelativorans sp. EGI FJ00035]MCT7378137.1 tripartite tricarboxylate transporter TctB family protein [Chelativorans sp. EGI FJ00035]